MTRSGEHSQPAANFNPASIAKYSVIRLPHKFSGESEHQRKRFVVLGHHSEHAICIKATSKVEIYKNNKELMEGCVFYKAKEVSFFEQETVVQPDNQVAIPYRQLKECKQKGELEILGQLPEHFEADLIVAIEDSITLTEPKRKRLIQFIKS